MFFKDIAGKNELKRQLVQSALKGRIPHAQIFLGREGSGGLPMALAFASYIMCENRSDDDSCGMCSSCLKSHKFIHPDIHFSFPVVKLGDKKRMETTSDDYLPKWRNILTTRPFMNSSTWLDQMNAENNLPNINVKECNDIIHKLNMMSYESPYKILIMWLPEYLGIEGNRLLKLIEEPTDNTYIILVAENQDHILQTILSRCRLVKVPDFEHHEIKEYLMSVLQVPETKAHQIANLADGNLNLAIDINKNEAADYSDLFIEWLREAYAMKPERINDWIKKITDLSKDEQKNFFEYGLHFFRQLNLLRYAGQSQLHLTDKEKETAARMLAIIDFDTTALITDIINETVENINRNINLKIALFADTVSIHQILKRK